MRFGLAVLIGLGLTVGVVVAAFATPAEAQFPILIVGGLTFFPALALGPIVEHFLAQAGKVY